MSRIVNFGEIMLRLMPPDYNRIIQADLFQATYGGGESNVSVSLAQFGMDSVFVTKLPNNALGTAALAYLRSAGVCTQFITRGGDRIGIYFVERGVAQRPSKVVYDRKQSAIAKVDPDELDWDVILEKSDWFHFTGITPALGDNIVAILQKACEVAKQKGLTISCDLNYRPQMWPEEKATQTMAELLRFVDICISNEEDVQLLFKNRCKIGCKNKAEQGKLNKEEFVQNAAAMVNEFGLKAMAFTMRESLSATANNWSGMLYTSGKAYFSPVYNIPYIVDRIGGGDSFAAGLIYAYLMGYEPQDAVNFSVAASCLKHTISGDANFVSVEEVTALCKGNSSGRIIR